MQVPYSRPMEFRLLGPLEVLEQGRRVQLGGPKQRAVLAFLLVRANGIVAADQLIHAVWGDGAAVGARNTLQSYISNLRAALGDRARIEGSSAGYLLHAEPSEVDAHRFEQLLAAARAARALDPASARDDVGAALRLWRGPPLVDLPDHREREPLRQEVLRLEELHLRALEDRIAADLEIGGHDEVIGELESLISHHPLRERLWSQAMIALYRAGRQAEALNTYQRLRTLLADELGIDPSPDVQHYHALILAQDPRLLISDGDAGSQTPRYELSSVLGRGPLGIVYRGSLPPSSRELAIKALHADVVSDPVFARSFEAEAAFLARLEHPHILRLDDHWRDGENAYLVMPVMAGGDLAAARPAEEVAWSCVIEQVAAGLAYAHARGRVHGNLKPSNVLLDELGNAYLTDFSLTAATARRAATSFTAPEIRAGEGPTVRSDVYAFAAVIAGLEPARQLVDEAALHIAMSADPRDRFPDVDSCLHALLGNDGSATAAPPRSAVRNPYKGLQPFREPDAEDFFGRESLTADLVERLARSRFVAVVGPSGSGKSSVVRAGVLPRLRTGALPGSGDWTLVTMHPGGHPLAELEAALLRVAANPPPSLMEQLERDDQGLLRAVKRVLPSDDVELVLVVDQFEELFTLTSDPNARRHFLACLRVAATEPRSRLRVLLTIRADLYDRPLREPGIAQLIAANAITVAPLTAEEVERAASAPARSQGVDLEPGLRARIVGDVLDQPGSLPLLQFVLTELFERRDGPVLTLAAYEALGGVSGALARRAETRFLALAPREQELTRQVMLRLVTLGEGVADARRRVTRSELEALDGDDGVVSGVLDAFVGDRLLSLGRDPASRQATVEVAHEALLWAWERLRRWIDDARDDLRTHRTLGASVSEWEGSGRDTSYLLRGSRLDRLERWASETGITVTPSEREFLASSIAAREAEDAEAAAQERRERELEQRALRRLRSLVVVLALAGLVGISITAVAFRQRQVAVAEAARAEQQVRLATARQLAAASVAELDLDPERSVLLALEAVAATLEPDGVVVPEAEEALHRAVGRSRVVFSLDGVDGQGLAVMENGSRFATSTSDGRVMVRELATGEVLDTFSAHDGAVTSAVFSPDDALLATAGEDGVAHLWDVGTGARLRSFVPQEDGVDGGGPPPALTEIAFSPDGSRLAATSWDTTVRIWNVATGEEEWLLTGHTGISRSPSFSPDGTRLATGGGDILNAAVDGDYSVRIWDLATGTQEARMDGHQWAVNGVAFEPNGRRVASVATDGQARLWDAVSGEHLANLWGHTAPVRAVAWARDGARLATGGADAVVKLWDGASGAPLLTLAGHASAVGRVAFAPDGARLLTSSDDGTVRMWDISVGGGRDWLTVPGGTGRFVDVAFSPDGTTFATPTEPDGVSIRDTDTGTERLRLLGHGAPVIEVAFSPDGGRLAATTLSDGDVTTVPVWDTGTGELQMVLEGHTDEVRAVAFSPDGDRILTGGFDGTARLWDAGTGEPLHTIDAGGVVGSVAYSPDGAYFVLGGDDVAGRPVGLWDAVSLDFVRDLGPGQAVAFGPDNRLVTARADSTARVLDVESGEELRILRGHHAPIQQLAVSADGLRVAATSADATTKLWDARTGRRLFTLHGHTSLVYGVDFTPDRRLLATASIDGTVALHLLPIEELRGLARSRLTRALTDAECREYLRDERCPSE